MKIIYRTSSDVLLEDFADKHGLVMMVWQRSAAMRSAMAYYAHFADVEVKQDSMLSGVYGDGKTQDEAIADYAKQISNTTIVYRAFQSDRKEITVPYLIYP